jgi:hypothetical protein
VDGFDRCLGQGEKAPNYTRLAWFSLLSLSDLVDGSLSSTSFFSMGLKVVASSMVKKMNFWYLFKKPGLNKS